MSHVARLFLRNQWTWLTRLLGLAFLATLGPLLLDVAAESGPDGPGWWSQLGPSLLRASRSVARLSPMLLGLAYCLALLGWVEHNQDQLVEATGRPLYSAWLPGLLALMVLQVGVDACSPWLARKHRMSSGYLGAESSAWGALEYAEGRWRWCIVETPAGGELQIQSGALQSKEEAPSALESLQARAEGPRRRWSLRPLLVLAIALVASGARRRAHGQPAPLVGALPIVGQILFVAASGPLVVLLGAHPQWGEMGALGVTSVALYAVGRGIRRIPPLRGESPGPRTL